MAVNRPFDAQRARSGLVNRKLPTNVLLLIASIVVKVLLVGAYTVRNTVTEVPDAATAKLGIWRMVVIQNCAHFVLQSVLLFQTKSAVDTDVRKNWQKLILHCAQCVLHQDYAIPPVVIKKKGGW